MKPSAPHGLQGQSETPGTSKQGEIGDGCFVAEDELFDIETTVFALVEEFEQAIVQADDETQFVLTRRTPGVVLEKLLVGQRLLCTVTRRLPRVLAVAEVVRENGASKKTMSAVTSQESRCCPSEDLSSSTGTHGPAAHLRHLRGH